MSMGGGYTNPDAAGYLLEAEACGKVVKELQRLVEKYQRKIDRTQAARRAEFEAAMEYSSERDIQDAYGWGFITEAQFDRYMEIFRQGEAILEHHTPTCDELAQSILKRILGDIAREQRDWRFSALSPAEQLAEQTRALQAKGEWKRKIAEIKQQLGQMPDESPAASEDGLAENRQVG